MGPLAGGQPAMAGTVSLLVTKGTDDAHCDREALDRTFASRSAGTGKQAAAEIRTRLCATSGAG